MLPENCFVDYDMRKKDPKVVDHVTVRIHALVKFYIVIRCVRELCWDTMHFY